MRRSSVYGALAMCWSATCLAYPNTQVLTVGLPAQVNAARLGAVKCGFSNAYLRHFRNADIPTQHPDRRWMTLDAAVDVATRPRELECFLNRVVRPGLKNFRE